jgi:polyisoprenoid-binding protein YceI
VAVVAVGAFLYLRDDAPDELSIDNGDSSSHSSSKAPAEVDGKWTVKSQDPTTAGFRITEKFLSGTASHTAVGRTSTVTGGLTISGTTVSEAQFTVDMTSLEYTDSPPGLDVGNRKAALKRLGIQTDQFPESSFKLTKPIDFGKVPADGQKIEAEATGELTLHGVTKPVTFQVDAQLDGGDLKVGDHSPVEVKLADYNIDRPVAGPVAEVADTGSFEFRLILNKG